MKRLQAGLVENTTFSIWLLLLYGFSFISGGVYNRPGYINIDCGNPNPDTDYMSDAGFIDTGIDMQLPLNHSYSGLKTVRSFPDGDRNCYTLKPSKGRDHNYLIRAHFYYGNYGGKNTPPVFDIYIGVSFWFTLYFRATIDHIFGELIHKPATDFIHLCLVKNGNYTPFISALYLRPLNDSIYNVSHLVSLHLDTSCSTGTTGYYQSYVDDIYDRFWGPMPRDNFSSWEPFSTSTDLKSLRNDAYQVPPSIFKGGIRSQPGNSSLALHVTPLNALEATYYFYLHFGETEKLGGGDSREFNISVNGNFVSGPIKLKYLEPITLSSSVNGDGDLKLWFSINQTKASTLPPILNALDIYYLIKIQQSATNQDDFNAIMDVKTKYGPMRGWQGDPCLPKFPWNGLKCSSNIDDSPRIISLDLSSRDLTGEILPSLSSLTALKYLNLSYNNLMGTIPEFLAKMPSLQVIDLRGNRLSGSVPIALTNKVKNGTSLSLDGNPDLCTPGACTQKSKKHKILTPLAASASLFVLLIVVAVFCACRWKRRKGSAKETKGEGGMKVMSQQFTYSEVINMTKNFRTILGKGGFGTVYLGSLKDGTRVAIKILNQSTALNVKSFRVEADLLTRVHHRNLVSLVGYCDERTTMALVYEYMANGNLEEHLSGKHNTILSWKERLQISVNVAQGLKYLHSGCKPAIVHRDMKPANILLDDKLQAKIADFGMSRIFETESASHISTDHVAGTPGYLDPE